MRTTLLTSLVILLLSSVSSEHSSLRRSIFVIKSEKQEMEVDIHLCREHYTARSTAGQLYFAEDGGSPFCFTLEDTVRAGGIKVKRETALPEGLVKVGINMSLVVPTMPEKNLKINLMTLELTRSMKLLAGFKIKVLNGCK